MSHADEFRRNADECRQQAEKSVNMSDKERWLKIAEHWLQMAEEGGTRRRTWPMMPVVAKGLGFRRPSS